MKITDINNNLEITPNNYENIFNVYNDENDFYYFNLLRKVDFPEDLDPDIFDYYKAEPDDFYATIAYKFYKDIKLFWVICASNQIDDPTTAPEPGTVLKIIKPIYLRDILTKINQD
jgi:hypothetical protein